MSIKKKFEAYCEVNKIDPNGQWAEEVWQVLARITRAEEPIGWLTKDAVHRLKYGKGNVDGCVQLHVRRSTVASIPIFLEGE